MKQTNKPTKGEQKQDNAPEKKSRSVKDRPKSADELVSAIEGARIDGRTAQAKRLQATRRMLAARPTETTLAIVKDTLAVNSVISAYMVQLLSRADFEVMDAAGNLNPILARHWPDTQKGILNAANALLRLEASLNPDSAGTGQGRRGKAVADAEADTEPVDVSAIVLQLAERQNKGA